MEENHNDGNFGQSWNHDYSKNYFCLNTGKQELGNVPLKKYRKCSNR